MRRTRQAGIHLDRLGNELRGASRSSRRSSRLDPAREVASVILEARLPPPLRLIGPAHRLSSAALLPARLREEYGLGWSRTHSVALALAAGRCAWLPTPLFLAAARTSPSTAAYLEAASVTAEG